MAYNDTTRQWELETEQETLQRLLNTYNQVVPNANMNINTISGTGLEGVLYTYIRGFYDVLQTGVSDLQAKMTFAIKEGQVQVLRPNIIKDNIKTLAKSKGLELAVFDLNDTKMDGNPEGIYLVVKRTLTPNQEQQIMADIGKTSVVAGVVMRGDTTINTQLSTGQQLAIKYTLATKLPFKIKVQIKRKSTSVPETSLVEEIKQEIFTQFQEDYTIGMDFNATDIYNILITKFSGLSDILVYHSLDNGLTYNQGSYIIPYNNYIDLSINDILIEVI
jgi:hypothetical protein